MKIYRHLILLIVTALSCSAAESSMFKPDELTLDLAGTYSARETRGLEKMFDTNLRHGKFGAGVGVTKFFGMNFGIGAETGIRAIDHINSVDYANIVGIARLPFDQFAPYVIAGIGRDFHAGRYMLPVGVGCEYRLTPRVGVFAEARFVFHEQKSNSASVGRFGVRLVF